MPAISQEADDLIIASEVGSRSQYDKKFRRPEWPGGLSGVTVGIGYDLGFADPGKIKRDWGALLRAPMVDAMMSCAGKTGDEARRYTAAVRNEIDVPWDAAIKVYETVDIPQWIERVCRAIPSADRLHPHCLGALTSLAYNRGASFNKAGERYREMRNIRSHIMSGALEQVDDEIRAMSRLWPGPNERGLPIRRGREADLWNKGLSAPAVPLPKPKPKDAPPPLAPPKNPGGAPEGTGGVIVSTGTGAELTRQGFDPFVVGCVVAAGIVITIGAVAYLRYRRSQPILARSKG